MKAWLITIDNDIIYTIDDFSTGDIVFANTKKEARDKFFSGDSYFNMWDDLKTEDAGFYVHKKEVHAERAPYADCYATDNISDKDFANILRKNGWKVWGF